MSALNTLVSIEIRTAPNGWIVTREEHRMMAPTVIAVFNRIEDLQEALPRLLGVEQQSREDAKQEVGA